MKINLITQEQHDKLLSIYNNYPVLTLQNKGYEGINRNLLTDEEKQQDKEVNEILKFAIIGFRYFQNFKVRSNGDIVLRFQYNYGAEDNTHPFTGVGYILLYELLNGFRD